MDTAALDSETARLALTASNCFSAAEVSGAWLSRLRGLTNQVFRVDIAGVSYSLRLSGAGTEAFIDRSAEEVHARIAAKHGLTPDILYFGQDGVMLSRFVNDSVPLSAAGFRERAGAVERTAAALRKLHGLSEAFVRDFAIFQTIDRYMLLASERKAPLPAGLAELIWSTSSLRDKLSGDPVIQRPCHCDPTGANLLDAGTEVVLVDWEYSGMNDPAWDLAYLSVQSDFDAAIDDRLVAAYFGRPANAAERGRIEVHKALVELMSATWALLQASGGNTTADFRGYAERTVDACRLRMAAPAFAKHLDALRSDGDTKPR